MRLRLSVLLALSAGAIGMPAPASAGLLDFLFGPSPGRSAPVPQRSYVLEPGPAPRAASPRASGGGGGGGRSVCVRLCDGYYFPLESVSTRGGSSLSDCEASCPGVAMGVFRAPGGDQMTEARDTFGRRYGDLEAAFSYRKALTPGCSCQRSAGAPSIMGDMTLRAGDIVVTEDGAVIFRGKGDAQQRSAGDFASIKGAGALPKGIFAQVDRVLGFSFQEAQSRQAAAQVATKAAQDDIVVTPMRTGTISPAAQAEARATSTAAGLRVILPMPSER